jgi:His/Glu/Gln/Arg/opine family amino acid ABC transporter permease subunit
MKFDISYTFDAIPRLLEGALITMQVAILGFILSVLLATTITIARTSLKSKIFNFILAFYISFIRGTPILIQIFLVYYVLPVFGLNLGPFTAGILAITLNSAAFVTEILRGGLASVPVGQFEAAKSLGISGFALFKVIAKIPAVKGPKFRPKTGRT